MSRKKDKAEHVRRITFSLPVETQNELLEFIEDFPAKMSQSGIISFLITQGIKRVNEKVNLSE